RPSEYRASVTRSQNTLVSPIGFIIFHRETAASRAGPPQDERPGSPAPGRRFAKAAMAVRTSTAPSLRQQARRPGGSILRLPRYTARRRSATWVNPRCGRPALTPIFFHAKLSLHI